MSKSHKRSHRRKHGGRRHNKTKKGGSMLSSAALPIALLGLNSLFGKKTKKSARRSRKMRR
jgi:hypothetical protein